MDKKEPTEGIEIELHDGRKLKFEGHSERVFLCVWQGNGAFIETFCYSQRQDGAVNGDRIHLFIGQGNGEVQGWLMTIEEAENIIQGLANAINKAEELGIPRS